MQTTSNKVFNQSKLVKAPQAAGLTQFKVLNATKAATWLHRTTQVTTDSARMIIYLFAVLFDAFSFSFSHIQKDKRVLLKAKVNKTQLGDRAETP